MALSSVRHIQTKLPSFQKLDNSFCLLLRHGYSSVAASVAHLTKDKAYVNGKWVSARTGKTYQVLNPSTGDVLGSVPDMDQNDAREAIKVAKESFESWKNVSARERSVVMRRWYDLCVKNKKELATLITLEMGKPLADAEGEIAYSNDFLEWFGEECKRVYGDVLQSPAANKRFLIFKQPIGVTGMITPWNFPSAMITRKAGAAIAAGCSVVLRPAEDTPLSALALCQLAGEAGLPAGVLNIITSDKGNASNIGKEICENPDVSKISFTGSTAVGKILLAQSASTVKKLSLELGGNAPFMVFDSADVDLAVQGLLSCKFRCSGQTCVSANRILVQEGIYDRFVDAVAKAISSTLKVGDGMDPNVNQGPLINKQAVEKVDEIVKSAVDEGAKVIVGGGPDAKGGNFYQPTLLAAINTSMGIAQREIFGPVVSAIKFKTESEAVTIANSSRFGLASYFYTSDMSQSWRVAEQLEFGLVGINEGLVSGVHNSFGGWKESGLGTEGGKYGLEEYIEKKGVCFGNI